MRDGFIIHEKTLKQMDMLDPEDLALLIRCMSMFYRDGDLDLDHIADISPAVAVIMVDVMERMTADAEAYERQVEQRREAAAKRWEKERSHADGMRDDATACERNAGDAVSVSVSVSDKDKKKTKAKEKFVAPTVEEVGAYCAERGNRIDAQAFVDFYASKGWKVGSQPMKDWKAAIRTWERRDKEKPPVRRTAFHNFPARDDPEHKDLVAQVVAMQ